MLFNDTPYRVRIALSSANCHLLSIKNTPISGEHYHEENIKLRVHIGVDFCLAFLLVEYLHNKMVLTSVWWCFGNC